MRARTVVALVLVLVMVSGAFATFAKMPAASANQGTKDTYGYRWTDNKAPSPTVTYNWVEINSTGTPWAPNSGDVVAGPYALGFTFQFYGNAYTQVYIGSNGIVGFGSSTGLTNWYNYNIPYSSTPNNYVAAYWDELYVYNPYCIYYQSVGSSPNKQFVIEYAGANEWYSSPMYFEILLNETGDIWMQYQNLNGMTGNYATVGLEDSTGSVGCRYSYNTASLSDGLAIKYSRGYVAVTPATQTHTARPGNSTAYTVNVTNLQNISDSIKISASSSLGWVMTVCDATTKLPLTDTDSDSFPDTGTLAPLASRLIQVNVTVPSIPASSPDVTTVNASSHANPTRYSTCTLTTNALAAWFAPPHTAVAYDSDADGDANYLLVNASVYIRSAGYYYMYGYLYSSSEWYMAAAYNYSAYYSAGAHTIQLWYYGWNIRSTGYAGPYHAHLTLYDNGGNTMDTATVTTAAYAATDFMDYPGTVSPIFTEYPVDTNGNGLYNYVQVNVTVDVNYAGQFLLYNYLYDSNGNSIGYQSYTSVLSVGLHTISFMWTSDDIRDGALYDGQFESWSYLYAYVDGSSTGMGGRTNYTRSYLLSQFDRPDAIFNPAEYNDYGLDVNSDTYYEWLVVEVGVNVTVAGTYTINGGLYDGSWLIESDSNTTYLPVGDTIVELRFFGWPIRENYEYPDNVHLELLNASSGVLDTDIYNLYNWYGYYDFMYQPALLGSAHTDHGVDTDSDGLYEWLVVEAEVIVSFPCTVRVHGDLYCSWWDFIDDEDNTTYLSVGTHYVWLWFPGWMLRADGDSGTYRLDYLYLYDEFGYELDYYYYITGSYNWNQFDTPPAALSPPHSSYAWCDDGDGLYEWLTVNMSVDVTTPGDFYIVGSLEDSSYNTYSTVADYVTTSTTGVQTFQLNFPGWLVNHHRVNGTNYAYFTLAVNKDTSLDWGSLTTAYYYWDDFDPGVPSIDSGWSTTAPIVNGLFSASEWAGATELVLADESAVNDVLGSVYVKNDASMLYICIDAYGDTTEDTSDYASISFDTDNNDMVTAGHDDEFLAVGSGSSSHWVGSGASWIAHCSPISTAYLNHSSLAAVAGFGTSSGHSVMHRVYEYAIPLNLLNVSMGDTLGFYLGSSNYNGIYDSNNGSTSAWPVIGNFAIGSFGQVVLASSSSIPPAAVTTAVIAATAGSNGWYRSAATVTFTRTGGAGGVDYTEYVLDGGSWTNYTAGLSITAEGTHTLQFRSMDNMSQLELTKTVTIKVDTSVPVTTSGKSGAIVWLNSSDTISGLLVTKYRVDGGSWTNYTGQITLTGLGNHTVEFWSEDNAGNREATKSVVVEVKEKSNPAGPLGGSLMWLLLIGAIAAAALILLFFVLKRRKGPQQPMMMMQPPMGYQQMGPPQQPPMQ